MINVPDVIPEAHFGVPWADQTTPAGAWQIASGFGNRSANGFNGGSFNSADRRPARHSGAGNEQLSLETSTHRVSGIQLGHQQQQLDDKSSV